MKKIDVKKIQKKYIDDMLNYFIYEMYYAFIKPTNIDILKSHLDSRVKDVLMGKFIIDYTINVHLSTIDDKRDERISFILDDKNEPEPEYYIEVAYRMSNKSFYSIKINEDLLNSYAN